MYMEKEELDRLLETSSYTDVVTTLVKKIKVILDFDSRYTEGKCRGFLLLCCLPFPV